MIEVIKRATEWEVTTVRTLTQPREDNPGVLPENELILLASFKIPLLLNIIYWQGACLHYRLMLMPWKMASLLP